MSTYIELGYICGLYGVRGELKVFSYTEPKEELLSYEPLYLYKHNNWIKYAVKKGKKSGKSLVIKFAGIDERDSSSVFIGARVGIKPQQLKKLAAGEFYQYELIGFEVENTTGANLGKLAGFIATGVNDVMEIIGNKGRILIPFTFGVHVKKIRRKKRKIVVDWEL